MYIFGPNNTQNVNDDGYRGGLWSVDLSTGTLGLLQAAVISDSLNDNGNLTTKAIIFDSDNLPILTTGHRSGAGTVGKVASYKWNGASIDNLGSPLYVSTGQNNNARSVRFGQWLYMASYGITGKYSTHRYDLSQGAEVFGEERRNLDPRLNQSQKRPGSVR